MRFLLFFLLSGLSFIGFSQYRFVPYQDTPVTHPNEADKNSPWAGGLNGVQYGKIDLNNDGADDLAGYDRSSGRIVCFLRSGNNYEYAPQYEKFFQPKSKTSLF